MRKIKILIIGKNSFIGSNLNNYFKKKKIETKITGYQNFLRNKLYENNYNYIINCASNKKFINKKYQPRLDYDYNIAKLILKFDTKLIFLSTRKIYIPKYNIIENSKKKPLCNYSKNKFLSEKNIKKILNKRITVLRISNIIGLHKKYKNKLHQTFIDQFIKYVRKGYIFENKKIYKDFISINKFSEIVFQIIKLNILGTYNVSLGKKVYLNNLIWWLNNFNRKKVTILKIKKGFNSDCFTLNNQKLMKKLKIKNSLSELKKDCITISKKLFENK